MVKKFIIVVLLILLAGLAGIWLYIPHFVDKDAIRNQFVSTFKAVTGLDVEISGDVIVKAFPSPHVVINSMYVHNSPGSQSSFLLSIKLVQVWPAFTSMFGKRFTISKIDIDDVDIELERLKGGHMNWEDSSVQTSAPKSLASLSGTAGETGEMVGTTITLTNGFLHFEDSMTESSTELKDITLTLLNGGSKSDSTMKVGFTFKDKPMAISGKIGNIQKALSAGEMPADLKIVSGKSDLSYEGNAGYKDGKFSINGKVRFLTDDIGAWISTFMEDEKKPEAGSVLAEINNNQFKLLPLEMKSDVTSENGKIIFPNITLEGTIIKGTTRLEITPPYDVDVKSIISELDLETLFESKFFAKHKEEEERKEVDDGVLGMFANADSNQNAKPEPTKQSNLIVAPKSLFSILSITGDIKIADILYNDQRIKDSHIQFDTTNGETTISQVTATLPGESRIVFAGIGKEGFQGFTLEGELDAAGADFTEIIKVLKMNSATLPAEDFKRFQLKANMIFNAHEFRLSEMAMRIEKIEVAGGLIMLFGERNKLNAAMHIVGVNLDSFVKIWGISEWHASLFNSTPGAQFDSFLARWLRRLDCDAHMNVIFEKFILNGMERGEASFKLTATTGKITLDDFKTAYNGSQMEGNFILDVTGALPKIDTKMKFDKFDADTFFTSDGKLPPPQPQAPQVAATNSTFRWSHKQFDFHWLELVNLIFKLEFKEYKQGLVTAQKLNLQGQVDEGKFSIDSLTGVVLKAPLAATVSIRGGKIPAIQINANVTSLDPVELYPFFPVLQGMSGRFNLSLKLDTSGIDMFSWVSSLEGTIGLGGANLNIHGFNLQGVIHAVAYVRTVADILNVVRRAFPGGDTMFTNIEGQWNVTNGVFRTANSRLVNEQATGLLTSEIDMVNWQMQSIIVLALKVLDPAHPPAMNITFVGNMDHPDIALDTRSLEQYVTNKTSQDIMKLYGTH